MLLLLEGRLKRGETETYLEDESGLRNAYSQPILFKVMRENMVIKSTKIKLLHMESSFIPIIYIFLFLLFTFNLHHF